MAIGESNFSNSTIGGNISVELLPLLSPSHHGTASSHSGAGVLNKHLVEFARLIPGFQSFEELLNAEDVEMVAE